MLVSDVQQSESVIRIHISSLFKILFPDMSLQNNEQSSLCYTVQGTVLNLFSTSVTLCFEDKIIFTLF